jgi:hypothetical protein
MKTHKLLLWKDYLINKIETYEGRYRGEKSLEK